MSSVADAVIDCSDQPVDAALWLARAFAQGRWLAVWAPGADDHAHHMAVEFVHPVVTGAQPLPAIAVERLSEAGPDDARLVIGDASAAADADLLVRTDQADVDVVRTYHLLWELVHVALEHPGLVGGSSSAGGDSTGFLYPFLDAAEADEDSLRGALAASAAAKVATSERLVAETIAANTGAVASAARAIADAVRAGGRVHVMGNGGSATDAARLARLLRRFGVRSLPLSSDYAVVTALANDVGVDRVFARQVEALTRPGDVLVGCSTSGTSANLLSAFRAADARGVLTVGISGYRGESFAAEPAVRHRLDVASPSVHRIQEAEAALMEALCAAVSGLVCRAGAMGGGGP